MYNRLEFPFKPVFVCRACRGKRTRRAAASEWVVVSPWSPRGKRVPDCSLRTGHSFRNVALAESASQNRCPIRSAASQWALLRKVYPGMSPQSGTRFPKPAPSGSRVPEFAYRAGCNFRLSLDWETTSHSHKNGRPGCLSEPPVWRAMSRPLACNVIPDHVVAV